ncbi:MAG TPA: hypothetical protein VG734_03345 [Lacunisphaera sp.]|nr:hypothetical protein [Lacunisphaera sp.]
MSLINEALKKAQKERGGEVPPLSAMPSIGGESAQRLAQRSRPSGGPSGLLIGLGVGGAVLVLVAVGAVFLLRKSPDEQKSATVAVAPPKPTTPPNQTAAATVAAVPAPAAPVVAPVVAPPAPTVTPPSAPASVPTTARIELPVATTAPSPTVVAEAPKPAASAPPSVPVVVAAAAPETPKPEASAARPGKLEPRAINFIESLRVAGIRASATDSKVLMNDRVYRLGTIVEHEMGLKLVGITANSLTFEDERGGTYTRTF